MMHEYCIKTIYFLILLINNFTFQLCMFVDKMIKDGLGCPLFSQKHFIIGYLTVCPVPEACVLPLAELYVRMKIAIFVFFMTH